jgi:hypothetical protein
MICLDATGCLDTCALLVRECGGVMLSREVFVSVVRCLLRVGSSRPSLDLAMEGLRNFVTSLMISRDFVLFYMLPLFCFVVVMSAWTYVTCFAVAWTLVSTWCCCVLHCICLVWSGHLLGY